MKRTTTFQRSLVLNITVGLLILGGVLLAVSVITSQLIARELSRSLVGNTIHRIDAQVTRYLEPVRENLEAFGRLVSAGSLAAGESDEEIIAASLQACVETFPQVTSVHLAKEGGWEMLLLRRPDSWLSRITDPDRFAGRMRTREWKDEELAPDWTWKESDYDARLRPWFQDAVEELTSTEDPLTSVEDGICWTRPYRFFTTGEPGISASIALHDDDEELMVLAFDVLLRDISSQTRPERVQTGIAFVVHQHREEQSAELMALPTHLDDPALLLSDAKSVGGVVSDFIVEAAKDGEMGGPPFRFSSGGEDWWGGAKRSPLTEETDIVIGAVVTENELLDAFPDTNHIVIGATLAMLIIALIRSRSLLRTFARPMEDLVLHSERMARLDFETSVAVDSPIEEVQVLASAQERTRRSLEALAERRDDLVIATQLRSDRRDLSLLAIPGYDLAVLDRATREIGGGVHDAIGMRVRVEGSHEIVVAGTASHLCTMIAVLPGEGARVAHAAGLLRGAFEASVRLSASPGDQRHQLYAVHAEGPETGVALAATVIQLDGPAGRATCLAHRDCPVLHVAADGSSRWIEGDAPRSPEEADVPLAARPVLELAPGDCLIAVTDSVLQLLNPARERLGRDRFTAMVAALRDRPAAGLAAGLEESLASFADGAPPPRDQVIFAIRRSL